MNDPLDTQLNALEQQQLIRFLASESELAYRFQHVLTQDTAYNSLLVRRRRVLHREIATVLEHADDITPAARAPLLAYHYWQAEEWQSAGEWAMRAGEQAMQVYALREAITEFERAMQAFESAPSATPAQYIDAILAWSQAAFNFRPRAEILERVLVAESLSREINDKARLVSSLDAAANVNLAQGYPSRALPALRQIYDLAQELGDERLLVAPAFNLGIYAMDNEPQAALAYLDRALELSRRYNDRDIEAYTLGTQGMILARMGKFEEAERASRAAFALLDQIRSPLTESDIYLFAGWLNLDEGKAEDALAFGQQGLQKAIAVDNMECVCYGFACVGFGNLQVQQLPEAIAAFQESIHRSQYSGAAHIELLARVGLAVSEIFGGKREALDDLETAFADAQAMKQTYVAALAAQSLGMIYLQLGDYARAKERLLYAREFFESKGLRPALERTQNLLAQLSEAQAANVQT
ncbi:MAG TPA: tetratricopeptide repeat protein [Anaerolineae bacterium]|nr:tetratricopeptide repeat protein [Anaerolineae bacterium]